MSEQFKIVVYDLEGNKRKEIWASRGENLRQLLLDHDCSPYTAYTRRLNCGGRGLCATCGVQISESEEIFPAHWHDRAAKAFGYPRLSCQIEVNQHMTVLMVDKWIWGARLKK